MHDRQPITFEHGRAWFGYEQLHGNLGQPLPPPWSTIVGYSGNDRQWVENDWPSMFDAGPTIVEHGRPRSTMRSALVEDCHCASFSIMVVSCRPWSSATDRNRQRVDPGQGMEDHGRNDATNPQPWQAVIKQSDHGTLTWYLTLAPPIAGTPALTPHGSIIDVCPWLRALRVAPQLRHDTTSTEIVAYNFTTHSLWSADCLVGPPALAPSCCPHHG